MFIEIILNVYSETQECKMVQDGKQWNKINTNDTSFQKKMLTINYETGYYVQYVFIC